MNILRVIYARENTPDPGSGWIRDEVDTVFDEVFLMLKNQMENLTNSLPCSRLIRSPHTPANSTIA